MKPKQAIFWQLDFLYTKNGFLRQNSLVWSSFKKDQMFTRLTHCCEVEFLNIYFRTKIITTQGYNNECDQQLFIYIAIRH